MPLSPSSLSGILVETRNIPVSIIVLLFYLCFHCDFALSLTPDFIHNFLRFFFSGFVFRFLVSVRTFAQHEDGFFNVCDFSETAFFQPKYTHTESNITMAFLSGVRTGKQTSQKPFQSESHASAECGLVFIFSFSLIFGCVEWRAQKMCASSFVRFFLVYFLFVLCFVILFRRLFILCRRFWWIVEK